MPIVSGTLVPNTNSMGRKTNELLRFLSFLSAYKSTTDKRKKLHVTGYRGSGD